MNRKKYLILTAMLSLLCINKTYAACTQEEINEFKKIEDEYKITYEFNLATKDYNVTIYNPYPDMYGYIPDEKIDLTKYISYTEKSITIGEVKPGKYEFKIISVTTECKNLKTLKVSLSNYNAYYNDPMCKGIEEFYLCQPTYDKKIDRETFESRVNTYKNTKSNKKEENIQQEEKKENQIIKYIKENLLQIIIIVIFIILVIITTITTIISIRKSRRLE